MSLDLHTLRLCYITGPGGNNIIFDCTQDHIDSRVPPGETVDNSDPDDFSPFSHGGDYSSALFYKTRLNFDLIKDAIDSLNVKVNNLSIGTIGISINDVEETPTSIVPDSLLFSDNAGSALNYVTIGSDNDLDPAKADTILIDYSIPDKLVFKVNTSELEEIIKDVSPPVGAETIDMEGNFIFNSGYLTEFALEQYNNNTGKSLQFDDSLIPKRFADLTYYSRNHPLILKGDQTSFLNELNIAGYTNGYAIINNHGLNRMFNGTGVIFTFDSNKPTMFSTNTTYYLRYKDNNRISLHLTEEEALEQDDSIAHTTKLNLHGTASGNNHKLTFSDLDKTLSGNYLTTQAVPRDDLVLRSGDKMTGPLVLHDHPSPLNGNSLDDDSLQAATKYFVEELISGNDKSSFSNNFSYVSYKRGDLFCSTGMYRLLVEINPNSWSINDSFHVDGNSIRNGIIIDIKEVELPLCIITYVTSNNTPEKGDRITNGTSFADVLNNFNEIAQARMDDNSDISVGVYRNIAAENLNSSPVSNMSFGIKDDVITNNMINDNAQISQAKLTINMSPVYTETDNNTGWNSNTSFKKGYIGLSAFSNLNFESNEGFIRIKEHGIDLLDIVKIPNNRVLGTTDSDNNNVVSLTFSHIVENGGGITNFNIDTELFSKFDSSIFMYSSGILTLRENGITVSRLQNIGSNTLLGRTSDGFGNVELLSIDDILENAGGIKVEDLSSHFILINDKLSLAKNSTELDRLVRIPSMTVLGNNWNTDADVRTIELSSNSDGNTVVYRKNSGEISCKELQLSNKKILESTIDSLMAYVPTGQLIFTSWCGDSCNFHLTDTEFNGGVNAISFTETSDERKKKNIEQISNAVDLISKLRGVTFDWKHNNHSSMGLIAQELEQHIPFIVNIDSEGFKNISYTSLIGLLIEGIKELSHTDKLTSPDNYENGTVVVIGDNFDCETTTKKADPMILGVVSNSTNNTVELYGRGKAICKVLGKVNKGDYLVSSSIPGYAIADNYANTNSVIGKSMSTKNNDNKGQVEIFVA